MVAGCTGGGGAPAHDASLDPDAKPDAKNDVDAAIDAGGCSTTDRLVTGELVDLASSPSSFLGVNGARFTLPIATSPFDVTAPNGRFELCAPRDTGMYFEVDAPGDYVDGLAYLTDRSANQMSGISFRTWTQAQATALYAQHSQDYRTDYAHVLVQLDGFGSDVMMTGTIHNAKLCAFDAQGTGVLTWDECEGAMLSGRKYILFPNVATGFGTATLSAGNLTVIVRNGQLTQVSLYSPPPT